MEPIPVINEVKQAQLTPVNEFMLIIQKRYNSSPNSLAAAGYREVMKMAEDFLSAERQFMNAAFTAGYEQAFDDLRNHNKTEPQNEVEKGGEK
jgi:hypothetical protein